MTFEGLSTRPHHRRLLQQMGITQLAQLAQADAAVLHGRLVILMADLAHEPPTRATVQRWVRRARQSLGNDLTATAALPGDSGKPPQDPARPRAGISAAGVLPGTSGTGPKKPIIERSSLSVSSQVLPGTSGTDPKTHDIGEIRL